MFYALLVMWFMWRLQGVTKNLRNVARGRTADARAASTKVVETLECCVHCGVHVPVSHSIQLTDDRFVCSQECRAETTR